MIELDIEALHKEYEDKAERARLQRDKAERDFMAAERDYDIAYAKAHAGFTKDNAHTSAEANHLATIATAAERETRDNAKLVWKVYKSICKTADNREWNKHH